MAEVAHVGEDHGDAVFVSGGNHFVVTDRAARLNNAGDAYRGCGIDAVAEREKASEAMAEPFTSRPSSPALIPAIFAE